MKLNKYSKSKTGVVVGSFTDRRDSTGSVPTQSSGYRPNRELWGQNDTGEDIDGDMMINGNVYVGEVTYGEEDETTPPMEELHEFDEEKGELYAEKSLGAPLVKAEEVKAEKSVESPEVYGKKLFLDYEEDKTNVLDLLEKWKAEILAQMGGGGNGVPEFGDLAHPVCLMAGTLSRIGARTWEYSGSRNSPIPSVRRISISGGVMSVELEPSLGYNINILAINVTQQLSGETDTVSSTISGEYGGAHWFEARWLSSTNTIQIREFHLGSASNQNWVNDDWASSDVVTRLNIAVFGYAWSPS